MRENRSERLGPLKKFGVSAFREAKSWKSRSGTGPKVEGFIRLIIRAAALQERASGSGWIVLN